MALAAISLTTCGVELVSTASADDVPSIVFLKQWGQRGSEPGQFDFPIDIAINKSDEIFVTDHLNFRIQKFNTNGKLLGHFEVLPNPGGIALDAKGNLQLTHIHASANSNSDEKDFVSVYSPTGKLLRRWGKSGTGEGEFDCPGGLAADQRGRVYVADQTNHRVQVFDGEGKFLFQWGEYGNETGQFGGKASKNSRVGGPQFVKFDSDGNIWTTEGANCRVQKFTPNGKFLAAWGSADDRPGGFGGYFTGFKNIKATGLVGPIALCFDAQGHLWISTVSGRVQQFAKDGEFLRGVGNEQGTEPGQFYAPHGIAFDSAGRLYIVDAYNHRIQKFDVGHQVEQKNR
jgi:sugar lactone lactonase YvrE